MAPGAVLHGPGCSLEAKWSCPGDVLQRSQREVLSTPRGVSYGLGMCYSGRREVYSSPVGLARPWGR
eukprot:3372930-Pyramimonas_sp.AAC.1